jgi:RNA polymerase sigma-70 factor, ECF subfamily
VSDASLGGTSSDIGSLSDAALIVAVARYNESALAEVYRRHGGSVHALAMRILGSDGRADDVTQDVFVNLWNRPERYDPARGSLRGFLITVAHGRAVDRLRSDTARSEREQRSARETATAGYDIDSQVWDLAVADHLRDALAALPDRERRPIEMSYFGGHTYREVADLLGEAEGTIKGRIRAGLTRLRAAMAQSGIESTWTAP